MEMTLAWAELLRLLPQAVGGGFHRVGDAFVQGDAERGWRLRVTRLQGPRLGALELERLGLEWEFLGFSPQEQEAFLARFRLHFHKGGG